MKRILLSIVILAASAAAALGQQVRGVELTRAGDQLRVKMNIRLQEALPGHNQTVVLTPQLRNAGISRSLKPVGVYSRNQWYYYERLGTHAGGTEELSFRKAKAPEFLQYDAFVSYDEWMNGAALYLVRETLGCCGKEKSAKQERFLAQYQEEPREVEVRVDTVYIEKTVVVEKEIESRTRSINGRAFIDFPVSDVKIYPEYHSNKAELSAMRTTIDNVVNNPDWILRRIWIKGYASPEGKHEVNDRLAKARTASLRDYIASQYRNIDPALIEVEHEAENWEGLRAYVEESSLPNKDRILEIIDGDRLPDEKEWMIKSRYPEDWKALLKDCLPFLRRTDYRIDYDIKEIINN